MFERLKDCADRINDQLGPHKASPRSGSVDRHRALAPCAPGNPGNLQVRRAMGGGASSGAARLGTVSYCDQGTLLSRAALRRAPAAPGRPLCCCRMMLTSCGRRAEKAASEHFPRIAAQMRALLPSAWGECGTNVEDAWPSVTLRSWLTRYLALHRGQSGMQRCYHLRALSDGCGDALD